MRRKRNFVKNCLLIILVLAQPLICLAQMLPPGFSGGTTLPAHSPAEEEYMRLSDQLVRQFHSSLSIKLEQLKDNFSTRKFGGVIEFRTGKYTGCRKDNNDKGLQYVVGELHAKENDASSKQNSFSASFLSCDKKNGQLQTVYQELNDFKYTGAVPPLTKESVLNGQRLFIADAQTPQVRWLLTWKHKTPSASIAINSLYDAQSASTEFYFLGMPLIQIFLDKSRKTLTISSFLKDEYQTRRVQKRVNLLLDLQESIEIPKLETIQGAWKHLDFPKFRQESRKTSKELSRLGYTKAISDSYGVMISNTFKNIIAYINKMMPETEEVNSVVAESQLFKELVLIEQKLRVGSAADTDFARIQIRIILQAIQEGQISIVDSRK